MRNRTTLLRVSVVLVAVLATNTGVAAAAENTTVQAKADTLPFGLLGPVGLAAVALGILGMALGVLRQRRKSQAAVEEMPEMPPAPAPVEDPAFGSYRRTA
ncbi:MAG TPA: hypothetical protein VJT49_31170 [Amycolatopsis sp.]|uniref:hypothetical protein n=1 Tax=Amycolatopsis sp. TaxID=37632 RepID=UPI002B469076|nr:hypothetical protein [Amycolatopsis sp.]HKS49495.1 hypothetical protein [Amycolatopsis sp.]